MTTHYEKIQALGNKMADNLTAMGVSASFSDGGLTLADKILEIQRFTNGLMVYADKSIAQSGDTVNLYALILDNEKPRINEDILFKGLLKSTATSKTLTANTWTLVGDKYEITTLEPRFYFSYTSNLWIEWDPFDEEYYFTTGSRTSGVIDSGNLHDFSVENGIISYYKDSTLKTYDASSKDLSKIKCDSSGCVINDYGVYGTTGSSGVATATYTCSGVGEFNVQAISGSIQSEPYEVLDCIFYDEAINETNTGWYNQGFEVSSNSEGTLLDRQSSSWGTRYANATSSSDTPFDIGTCIEFDIVAVTGGMRLQIIGGVGSNYDYFLPSDTTHHVKIVVDSDYITRTVDNGTPTQNPTSTYVSDKFKVVFAINGVGSVRYKNFKIYPI